MEERKETKKTQVEKGAVKEEVRMPPTPAQPELSTPAVATPSKEKSKQTVITLAIVGGVVLFFIGLGMGYLLGHSTANNRGNFPGNGTFTPPENGGGRRFYPNSSTNNGTDNNTNSGSNDTNSKTQTN